jgi:hypothetical protein
MVQPAFQAPLVAAVGAASLLETGFVTTRETAITLPTIAVQTDPEHRVATTAAADPLPENHFAMNRHARPQTGLDNGSRSWQVRTSFNRGDLLKVAKPGPCRLQRLGPSYLPPSRRSYTFGEPPLR